jgi:AcrR family transcriptional regulator
VGRGKKIDDVSVVVQAATKMIDERGIEEFSTRRLAAALHISAMTLYNYFEDKDAILKAVALYCLDQFNKSMEKEIASSTQGESADNPMRAFKAIARKLLALGMAKPRLYLFLFDSSLGSVRDDPEVSVQYRHFSDWIAPFIDDAVLAAELKNDVLLFQLLANSLAVGSIRWPGRIDEEECRRLIDRAFDRILSRYESKVSPGRAVR